jgi:hypothetical protein
MSINMTLTDEQAKAAAEKPDGVRLNDPGTNREYVLVRADVYDQLLKGQYDDSPWTAEERDSLALEAGKHAGWDEMSEYDNYPEKP